MYSGDLLQDLTTHLVFKDHSTAVCGEKYVTAEAWGIPVLPYTWLQDSAAQQQLLPAPYPCHPPQSTGAEEVASPATKMQLLSLQAMQKPVLAAGRESSLPDSLFKAELQDQQQHHHQEQEQWQQPKWQQHCKQQQQHEQQEAVQRSDVHPQHSVANSVEPISACSLHGLSWQQQPDCQEQASQPQCLTTSAASNAAQYEHADSIIPDSQLDEPFFPFLAAHMPALSPVAESPATQQAAAEDLLASTALLNLKLQQVATTPAQVLPTNVLSDSGSETDISAVPDSQQTAEDAQTAGTPSTSHSTDGPLHCDSTLIQSSGALSPAAPEDNVLSQSASFDPVAGVLSPDLAAGPRAGDPVASSSSAASSEHAALPLSVCSRSCSPSADCPSSALLITDSNSEHRPATSYTASALVIDDSGSDSDSDFQIAARPLLPGSPAAATTSGRQLSSHSQSHRQPHAVKMMLRGPRGTTVKQFHGLHSLKGVQFAEVLQVDEG